MNSNSKRKLPLSELFLLHSGPLLFFHHVLKLNNCGLLLVRCYNFSPCIILCYICMMKYIILYEGEVGYSRDTRVSVWRVLCSFFILMACRIEGFIWSNISCNLRSACESTRISSIKKRKKKKKKPNKDKFLETLVIEIGIQDMQSDGQRRGCYLCWDQHSFWARYRSLIPLSRSHTWDLMKAQTC